MEQLNFFSEYLHYMAEVNWLTISVLGFLVINLFFLRLQQQKNEKQTLKISSLEKDLHALANAAIGVGSRVLKVEREQRNKPAAANATEQVVSAANQNMRVDFYNSSSQPYEQAIRMAQTGATVDDIMDVCGLSQSEVELVCMMHRLDKAS